MTTTPKISSTSPVTDPPATAAPVANTPIAAGPRSNATVPDIATIIERVSSASSPLTPEAAETALTAATAAIVAKNTIGARTLAFAVEKGLPRLPVIDRYALRDRVYNDPKGRERIDAITAEMKAELAVSFDHDSVRNRGFTFAGIEAFSSRAKTVCSQANIIELEANIRALEADTILPPSQRVAIAWKQVSAAKEQNAGQTVCDLAKRVYDSARAAWIAEYAATYDAATAAAKGGLFAVGVQQMYDTVTVKTILDKAAAGQDPFKSSGDMAPDQTAAKALAAHAEALTAVIDKARKEITAIVEQVRPLPLQDAFARVDAELTAKRDMLELAYRRLDRPDDMLAVTFACSKLGLEVAARARGVLYDPDGRVAVVARYAVRNLLAIIAAEKTPASTRKAAQALEQSGRELVNLLGGEAG